MEIRGRFHRKLDELREDILSMGSQVGEEMHLALDALDRLDPGLARQVPSLDREVNQARYALEDKCTWMIASQQPTARDLRAIVTVMSMNVDLERMGDQAKGIAKFIPHLVRYPDTPRPPELGEMGAIVHRMLQDVMQAYAEDNVELARDIAGRDEYVDALYSQVYTQMMVSTAETKDPQRVEALYEVLRTAREIERFGDLAVNLAERVIFLVTGSFDAKG